MKTGIKNEMLLILSILKSPEIDYNASSLARQLKITPMGALKIARRLKEQEIISERQIGKANIYKINFKDYPMDYLKFLLKKEAQDSKPYVKRWINELRKIKSAKLIIIFGSLLHKQEEAKDIDVLFVVEQKSILKLKKEIESINLLNPKKIHPLFQSQADLERNIRQNDKVILSAIKGIVISGEDIVIEVLQK